jgi:hypothetical protein
MSNWENALTKICEKSKNQQIEWVLVGSVGSVLQGCERVDSIMDALKGGGFDKDLLFKALSTNHLA